MIILIFFGGEVQTGDGASLDRALLPPAPALLPCVVQVRAGEMHPSTDIPRDALAGRWKGDQWVSTVPVFTQPDFLGLFVQIKCELGRKNTYRARSWGSPPPLLGAVCFSG